MENDGPSKLRNTRRAQSPVARRASSNSPLRHRTMPPHQSLFHPAESASSLTTTSRTNASAIFRWRPIRSYATARLSFQGCGVFTMHRVVAANQRTGRDRHCARSADHGAGHFCFHDSIRRCCAPDVQFLHFFLRAYAATSKVQPKVRSVCAFLQVGILRRPQAPFAFGRDGDSETITFQVTPRALQPATTKFAPWPNTVARTTKKVSAWLAIAACDPTRAIIPLLTKRWVWMSRPLPNLHVGFLPGTGDDVPQALEDLGVQLQTLSAADIETGDLSRFDAIVLGVRAYAVRPELRSANSRLLNYVNNGGVLIVQYNVQNFDPDYGPYSLTVGKAPRVVDEASPVKILEPKNPLFNWPNKITTRGFRWLGGRARPRISAKMG